jgi:hypothetical protein
VSAGLVAAGATFVGPASTAACRLSWRSGPPVTPDARTGRQWAIDELSKAEYHQHTSILRRVLDWIAHLFSGKVHGLPNIWASLVVVAVVVAGVLVAYLVAGPVRRTARDRASHVVLTDDALSADELRDRADEAAQAGHWERAVVERFRAVVRSLEERTVLDEQPGRTADEAAHAAGDVLPPCADDLVLAARAFDDVLYGHAEPGPAEDRILRAVDARVRQTRPVIGGVDAVSPVEPPATPAAPR